MLILRILGCVTALMIFFEIGPEIVWSAATGHIVLYDLATAIVTIFIFAAEILPLLTEYGLMEMVGTLLSRIFKRAFRLPGRSCIVAQFVGLSHLFVEYYLTVVVAGLITALITPRIPPLSRKPDHYSEVGKQLNEDVLAEGGLWRSGLAAALDKAQQAPGLKQCVEIRHWWASALWVLLSPSTHRYLPGCHIR